MSKDDRRENEHRDSAAVANNDNGAHVTQREFQRFLNHNERQWDEIKQDLQSLHKKVDKINTEKIPDVQKSHVKLDTRTKTIWTFIVGSASLAGGALVKVLITFL